MSFQLQITVSSIEEAERILACLRHDADPTVVKDVAAQINPPVESGPVNPQVDPPAADKPKRGRPRREVAPPLSESAAPGTPQSTEAEAPNAGTAEVEVTPAQQTYTLDDARKALQDVQAKYGTADMAKPLEILGKFGAGRVSEVKAEDYAKFVDACKAA